MGNLQDGNLLTLALFSLAVTTLAALTQNVGTPVHEDMVFSGPQQVSVLEVRSLQDLPLFNSPDLQFLLLHPEFFSTPSPPVSVQPTRTQSTHITPAVLVASNVPSSMTSVLQTSVSENELPSAPPSQNSHVHPMVLSGAPPIIPDIPSAVLSSTEPPIVTSGKPITPNTLTNTSSIDVLGGTPSVPSIDPLDIHTSLPSHPSNALTPTHVTLKSQSHATAEESHLSSLQSSETASQSLLSVPVSEPSSLPDPQSQSFTPQSSVSGSDSHSSAQSPTSDFLPSSSTIETNISTQNPHDASINTSPESQPPTELSPQDGNFIHQPVEPTPLLVSSTSIPPSSSPQAFSLSVTTENVLTLPNESQISRTQDLATQIASDLSTSSPVAINRILHVGEDASVNTLPSNAPLLKPTTHAEVPSVASGNQTSFVHTQRSESISRPLDIAQDITPSSTVISDSVPVSIPTIALANETESVTEALLTLNHPVRLLMPGAEEVTARRFATQALRDAQRQSTTSETTTSATITTPPTVELQTTSPTTSPPIVTSDTPTEASSTTLAAPSTTQLPAAPPQQTSMASFFQTHMGPILQTPGVPFPQIPSAPLQDERAPGLQSLITASPSVSPTAQVPSTTGAPFSLDPLTSLFLSVSRAAVKNVESAATSFFNGQHSAPAPATAATDKVLLDTPERV